MQHDQFSGNLTLRLRQDATNRRAIARQTVPPRESSANYSRPRLVNTPAFEGYTLEYFYTF